MTSRESQEPIVAIAAIANSIVTSKSMSGGDKILFELLRTWEGRGFKTSLLLCADGLELAKKHKISSECFVISKASVSKHGLIIGYLMRIIQSISSLPASRGDSIFYASSDFLTDVVPAVFAKLRRRGSKLVCALFLVAPNPLSLTRIERQRGVLFFLTQQVSIALMRIFADIVFVLNNEDRGHLVAKGISPERIDVISGGVSCDEISGIARPSEALYDGCFIGRFSEQKGLHDLIEIWQLICRKKPAAKLAIVGWGSSLAEAALRAEVVSSGLEENVVLAGFLDGKDKIALLKSSRLLLFPSHRESWGLVACEAMAAGVPVVAYDLSVFDEAFPGGIKKVPLGNTKAFSDAIIELLENAGEYQRLVREGFRLASKYDWDVVSEKISDRLKSQLLENSSIVRR